MSRITGPYCDQTWSLIQARPQALPLSHTPDPHLLLGELPHHFQSNISEFLVLFVVCFGCLVEVTEV